MLASGKMGWGGKMQRAYREGKGEGEKDNEEEVEGGRDEKETE